MEYIGIKADNPIVAFNTPHSGITMTHETMARIMKKFERLRPQKCDQDPQCTLRAMDMYGAEIK